MPVPRLRSAPGKCFGIDKVQSQAYLFVQLGAGSVNNLQRTIAVFGICLVSISLVVSPIDDPETTYNESEIPVNVATPVSVSATESIQLTLRATSSTTIFPVQRMRGNRYRMRTEPVTERMHGPHFRFNLCHTLLC